jgi:twitching motility protein PilJ
MKAKGVAALKGRDPWSILFALLLAASIVVLIAGAVYIAQNNAKDQRFIQLTADLRAQMFNATTQARIATAGNDGAFTRLNSVVANMESRASQLEAGLASQLPEEVQAYSEVWKKVKNNAGSIVKEKDNILLLHTVARQLNDGIPALQAEYDTVVEILLENRAPADQVAQARSQTWRAERIARNVDKMLAGGEGSTEAADQFNFDADLFGKVLSGMQSGNRAMGISRVTDPDARESLSEIVKLFQLVGGKSDDIYQAAPILFDARAATDALLDDQSVMIERLNELSEKIDGLSATRRINNFFMAVIGGVSLICVIVLAFIRFRATRADLQTKELENETNQQAILRLLDELADLADGDLTTTATVSEDFTGAIADSINFTIDQLRILVSQINDTAVRVSTAAQETQSTALHLAEASEHQAQEIAGASAAVNEMAVTIDQVSANASESAAVAERSVSIANKGAEVVQNTIQGMDNIREQIQETSKRIKRLGESSQEIGDIVSLINDIADQTNILALNAAIQASMAGEAGRGFAVVADEVQRLAERSSAATKQIEALVKTIQTDTNEAVASMEQTTTEVVRGARLAQDAGVALEEIENVSTNLAELIQNISNAARQQASSAGHISRKLLPRLLRVPMLRHSLSVTLPRWR